MPGRDRPGLSGTAGLDHPQPPTGSDRTAFPRRSVWAPSRSGWRMTRRRPDSVCARHRRHDSAAKRRSMRSKIARRCLKQGSPGSLMGPIFHLVNTRGCRRRCWRVLPAEW
jgi:hypothetical protein